MNSERNSNPPAVNVSEGTDAGSDPAAMPGKTQRAGREASGTRPREIGGPSGLEPTRYGDWERRGRCIDF